MRKLLFDPLVVGLALAAAACSDGDLLGTHQGGVRFVLTSGGDAIAPVEQPVPTATQRATHPSLSDDDDDHEEARTLLQSANVTFSSVLARNLDGVLVDVAMELPVTLDVMLMDRGKEIVLPDGELPPATYDQIVVVMTHVEVVTHDGTTIAITPPGRPRPESFDPDIGKTVIVMKRFHEER